MRAQRGTERIWQRASENWLVYMGVNKGEGDRWVCNWVSGEEEQGYWCEDRQTAGRVWDHGRIRTWQTNWKMDEQTESRLCFWKANKQRFFIWCHFKRQWWQWQQAIYWAIHHRGKETERIKERMQNGEWQRKVLFSYLNRKRKAFLFSDWGRLVTAVCVDRG